MATLFSLGPVALGSLAAGVLLEALGSTPTLLVLLGLMLVASAIAFASSAVRDAPRLTELEPT